MSFDELLLGEERLENAFLQQRGRMKRERVSCGQEVRRGWAMAYATVEVAIGTGYRASDGWVAKHAAIKGSERFGP
jgi:hypothetical protein